MPRRISDYPDAFAGWNLISSSGSLISVVATWLFLFVLYVQLVQAEASHRYPWLKWQFYGDLFQTLFNRNYNSLEWALNSPPKPHAFVSLPLQSGFLQSYLSFVYNGCILIFFYLKWLYQWYPIILKYIPLIFNSIKDLGFLNSLDIAVNILYSFRNIYLYIWNVLYIIHIIGYLFLPFSILAPVSFVLFGTLVLHCSILYWNNFVYKAHLNDNFLLFTLNFIIFIVLLFIATISIIAGLFGISVVLMDISRLLNSPSPGTGPGSSGNGGPSDPSQGPSGGPSGPSQGPSGSPSPSQGPSGSPSQGQGPSGDGDPDQDDDTNSPESDHPYPVYDDDRSYHGDPNLDGKDPAYFTEDEAEDFAKKRRYDNDKVIKAREEYLEKHKTVEKLKEVRQEREDKYYGWVNKFGRDDPIIRQSRVSWNQAEVEYREAREARKKAARNVSELKKKYG